MPNLGPTEILIIVFLVLLLFGAQKLPDLARSMGRSARIFKSEVKEMRREDAEDEAAQAAQSTQAPHAAPRTQTELPPAPAAPETRSTVQQDDFWDRPENQPRR